MNRSEFNSTFLSVKLLLFLSGKSKVTPLYLHKETKPLGAKKASSLLYEHNPYKFLSLSATAMIHCSANDWTRDYINTGNSNINKNIKARSDTHFFR